MWQELLVLEVAPQIPVTVKAIVSQMLYKNSAETNLVPAYIDVPPVPSFLVMSPP